MCSTVNYTFVIPHKNIPHLLRRCISSIPPRQDVQIIIVDDNSSTEIVNADILPLLGTPGVEIYFTKEGKGAGYARNVGMKHARGKWLLFADADDFYHAGFLDILDKYCETNNDIIYFSADSVDSETLQKASRSDGLEQTVGSYKKGDPYCEAKIRYTYWVPWNKMFNRKFIQSSHLYFEEILSGNDAFFVVGAGYLATRIEVEPRALYCVTYRRNSLTFFAHREIRRCSFAMRLRLNTFFKQIGEKKMRLPLYGDVYDALRNYGFSEFIWYVFMLVRKRQFFFSTWRLFLRIGEKINVTP